jgi:6-phosphogluconolactonase
MVLSCRLLCLAVFAAIAAPGCKNYPGVREPDNAEKIAGNPILYIGTYTEKEAHVTGKATGIYIYEMNAQSGQLALVDSSPATTNPSYLAVHPGKNLLYAVNETGSSSINSSGNVSAFNIRDGGRKLELVNSVASGGSYPCYISIHHTAGYAMAANYGSGTVALFPINADGSLSEASSVDQHTGRGQTGRQESAHAHMVIQSPHSFHVYSCDLGTDKVYCYYVDTINSTLVSSGREYKTMPGAGPRHMAFHPERNMAYIVNELNGTIEAVKIDSLTGSMDRFQVISTKALTESQDASCADIHITATGKYLYASNRAELNNIAIYSVHPTSGELALIGHQQVKGRTPRSFVIDPSGNFLLVANQDSDNIITYRIDKDTGRLIDTGFETTVPTPVCLKFLE